MAQTIVWAVTCAACTRSTEHDDLYEAREWAARHRLGPAELDPLCPGSGAPVENVIGSGQTRLRMKVRTNHPWDADTRSDEEVLEDEVAETVLRLEVR